ncbi:MAG: Crp/Fnr family transcriptional regulator, partial [Actinomycetota bacterium]
MADYCWEEGLLALKELPWGSDPPPWAPGRREEVARMERMETEQEAPWCLSEVDIFRDLSPDEMDAIARAAPMRTFAAGELLYSPLKPVETLFILKRGRVRIFRVSADGRALTTALVAPGTIFGEMVLLGQRMYDNFAEAVEESVVCVMDRADVNRFLLSDARIA